MPWVLDEYYFNRAGDKVKYLGYNCVDDKAYIRRESDNAIYLVNNDDGKVSRNGEINKGDILSRGSKPVDDNLTVCGYESCEKKQTEICEELNKAIMDAEYWPKLPDSLCKDQQRKANAEMKKLIDSVAHLKKIEPLDNSQISIDPEDILSEIINVKHTLNDLIAGHNARIG